MDKQITIGLAILALMAVIALAIMLGVVSSVSRPN